MARQRTASNVSNIEMSAIKEMAMLSAKVEGAASLTWGVPSFRTPAHIRDAVADALADDPNIGKYALPDGLRELRELAASSHREATGNAVDPDTEVFITAGNVQGLNSLFHVLIDPGDEVILTDPGFPTHVQQVKLCGGVPVFWPLDESSRWSLDVPGLQARMTPRTKAIVLVSPANPTGTIFTEADLLKVAQIAASSDVLVLLDDPYHHFCYENHDRFFNLASASDYREHVLYLFTFSKCFAMSGWRVGYMVIPQWLKAEVLKVHDATMICAPRISQVAAIAALSGSSSHLLEFERILGARRELICERLDRLSSVFEYCKPEGSYYVFPKIITEHGSSKAFAIELLEQARVTVTPGSAFGPTGEHHVRMAFCVDDQTITTAFDRMERHFGMCN